MCPSPPVISTLIGWRGGTCGLFQRARGGGVGSASVVGVDEGMTVGEVEDGGGGVRVPMDGPREPGGVKLIHVELRTKSVNWRLNISILALAR